MTESFFLPSPDEKGTPQLRTNVHVMVDLETLGTKPNAPVIAIGACLFDPLGTDTVKSMYGRSHFWRVSIADALKHGEVDGSTIAWWFAQDDAAIKALVGEDTVALNVALMGFRQFCEVRSPKIAEQYWAGFTDLPQACLLWAKSPDFDCKILEYAYNSTGERMAQNLGYHSYRCVRTVQDLGFPDPDDVPEFAGVKHDPRADAVNQALVVQAAYSNLGLTGGTSFDTF